MAAARRAFDDPDGWSQQEPAQRAAAIERLAAALEARAGEMAQRVSAQNGMPISIATLLEGGFPVVVLRYMASLAANATFEEERPGHLGGTTIVRREPIGVVGRCLATMRTGTGHVLALRKLRIDQSRDPRSRRSAATSGGVWLDVAGVLRTEEDE